MPAAGLALADWTDLNLAVGSARWTKPDNFINDALKRNYIWTRFSRGKGMADMFQGGSNIKFNLIFSNPTEIVEMYKPGAETTYTSPQTLKEATLGWRHLRARRLINDHEMRHNHGIGDSRFSSEYVAQQFVNLVKLFDSQLYGSILDYVEERFWANGASQQAEMENTDGSLMYSLNSLVTEDVTDYHQSGWTNIHGIDPATESAWRNQTQTYDYDDPDDSAGQGDGLIDAFDDMLTDVDFRSPDVYASQANALPDSEQWYRTDRQIILCSAGGLNLMKRLLRALNDRLVVAGGQDASYNRPTFNGVELVWSQQMASATIFGANGQTNNTELSATPDGYRYYWLNGNYLKWVFHIDNYFKKMGPFRLERQPDSQAILVDSTCNMGVTSRRHQGIVFPAS